MPNADPLPELDLSSFAPGFHALVIGASGGIGQALVQTLQAHPRCGQVVGLHRHSTPALDFDDAPSIAHAAQVLQGRGPFQLIVNAAGVLHTAHFMPEKKLADLNLAQLQATFHANTFGPALVLAHFAPLLDPQRGVLACLSARVGSIGDNRLGGWYSYRASKAALNMLVKTAAIELARSKPHAVLASVHPGTVSTALSKPFKGEQIGRPPRHAARDILQTLNALQPVDSGCFVAYDGQPLPW